jgi:hypothetical protein
MDRDGYDRILQIPAFKTFRDVAFQFAYGDAGYLQLAQHGKRYRASVAQPHAFSAQVVFPQNLNADQVPGAEAIAR